MQGHIERVFDAEFKRWLRENQIMVDTGIFHLTLPPPSNFSQWRKQQMDSELLSTLSMASDSDFISKRFALQKFGQWTQEDILTNERLLREEKGLDPTKGSLRDLPVLYFPQEAEAGGFDGGMGGSNSAFGGMDAIGDDLDLGDDEAQEGMGGDEGMQPPDNNAPNQIGNEPPKPNEPK